MRYGILLLLLAVAQWGYAAGPTADVQETPLTGSADSIPCLIVTDSAMQSVFEAYAEHKTREGTRSEVVTVESIQTLYPGDSLPQQVRNCIRDYYANKHTEWVLLGGDVDVIPAVKAYYRQTNVMSDAFYSCLDFEWNENGNDRFGELLYKGDTVDYTAEVVVGRLPCNTPSEATGMLSKIIAYQRTPADYSYQTDVLMTGTNVISKDDQFKGDNRDSWVLLTDLAAYLPQEFNDTLLYAVPASDVKAEFNRGYGLIVNSSQTQDGCSFLTHWTTTWIRERVDYTFFADSIQNQDRYGVFVNLTCHNANLDLECATARYYLLNPQGGGVAYVGASDLNWSTIGYPGFHREMFRLIFEEGVTEPARALTLAKDALEEPSWHCETSDLIAFYSYMFFGDPHMRMWTARPRPLNLVVPTGMSIAEDSLSVHVLSDDSAVANALVCLTKDSTVYEIATTDSSGVATFTDLAFDSPGTMSVTASGTNLVTRTEWVEITESCCIGMRGNVDCSPDDFVTMDDMTALIDHLFITLTPLCCELEAELDLGPEVTMGDLTVLIDHLFNTLAPLPACP